MQVGFAVVIKRRLGANNPALAQVHRLIGQHPEFSSELHHRCVAGARILQLQAPEGAGVHPLGPGWERVKERPPASQALSNGVTAG
jgi:hypothetical protein